MFYNKKSHSLEHTNSNFTHSAEEICEVSTKEVIYKNKPAKHNPFLGFFYTLLTSVFFTLTSVIVKKLDYINPGYLSMFRNFGVFAGCLPIAMYSTKEVIGPKKDRILLIARGFLATTALYLHFIAFRYLPLAEAAIVLSVLPALTTVAAHFYLKEPCGKLQILCLFLSLCGVLFSLRLPVLLSNRYNTRFDSSYMGGLASAFAGVILFTFSLVALRKMKDLHFSVPTLYFGFCGMIGNAVISYSTSVFVYLVCGWDQIFVMLIGIFAFLGYCTMTLAVQAEDVGVITVIRVSLDIIGAIIVQIIFFDNDIDMYIIIGACFAIVSVGMFGFNKWLHMLPEESKTKKKFKCFL